MKKLSLIAMVLALLIVIAACGSDNHPDASDLPTSPTLPTSPAETEPQHNHTFTTQQSVERTCIEAAHTLYICECGYTEKDYWAGIDELGEHEWDWETYTCLSPVTCSVCGTTDGSPRAHVYHDVVTSPTCTQNGFTTYTCICENPACTCRDSYITDKIQPLGHTWNDGFCLNCGEPEPPVG